MTSTHLSKRPKPWWNDECRTAWKSTNKAWGIFRRYPTKDNLLSFKKMRARARYVSRQSQHSTFRKYISSITSIRTSRAVGQNKKNSRKFFFFIQFLVLHLMVRPPVWLNKPTCSDGTLSRFLVPHTIQITSSVRNLKLRRQGSIHQANCRSIIHHSFCRT